MSIETPLFTCIYQITTKCKSYFTHYCQIYTRNKYVHQIGHIGHTIELSDVYIWASMPINVPHMNSMYIYVCVCVLHCNCREIKQLHIIHLGPRIMIVYNMISKEAQNNLVCISRLHGIDILTMLQWGCQ